MIYMYTHLKEREYYENLYDKMTVADARRGQHYYDDFVARLAKEIRQLDPPDDLSRPGNALLMNMAYMQLLGYELLSRYERREQTINEWMGRDRARDQRISDAKLKHEPPCQHCGKLGIKCNYKMLMQRDQSEELVLLLFRCDGCHKNSAYWEDGAPYEVGHDDKPENCEITTKTNPPKRNIPRITTLKI